MVNFKKVERKIWRTLDKLDFSTWELLEQITEQSICKYLFIITAIQVVTYRLPTGSVAVPGLLPSPSPPIALAIIAARVSRLPFLPPSAAFCTCPRRQGDVACGAGNCAVVAGGGGGKGNYTCLPTCCSTNLIHVFDGVTGLVDKKGAVSIIYLDFRKCKHNY